MAAEVQRQLEETRREMRRGVLELPDEATEAANAMRRVVSDQIKALKELTAAVAASGGDFDVADPTPAKPAARAEAPRNAELVRPAPIAADDEEIPAAEPVVRPPAPQAVARAARAAPPTAAPPVAERSQTGWLSNLLAAASRDEAPAPSERSTQEAPDGISLDIAKYVDTEAAAEMWDRWRGGDAGAVVAPAVHGGRPADLRRDPPALSQRSAVPERRHPLLPGIRTPAGQARPERS